MFEERREKQTRVRTTTADSSIPQVDVDCGAPMGHPGPCALSLDECAIQYVSKRYPKAILYDSEKVEMYRVRATRLQLSRFAGVYSIEGSSKRQNRGLRHL
jgi:hypothetical protein